MDEDRLCSTCAAIKIDFNFGRRKPARPIASLRKCLVTVDCALCAIVTALWTDIYGHLALEPVEQARIIAAFSPCQGASSVHGVSGEAGLTGEVGLKIYFCAIHWRWDSEGDETPERGLYYLPILRIDPEDSDRSKELQILKSDGMMVRSARRLTEGHCDLEQMKSHLQRCIEKHGDACERPRHEPWKSSSGQASLQPQLPANFRVVDVESLQIVEGPPKSPYVALSYLWDHANKSRHTTLTTSCLEELRKPGGIITSCLPQTVADAIQVCRRLGTRYLWVDSLSIIQDDAEDLKAQLHNMDTIYALALLTIVECNSSDPSQGLACLRSRSPSQMVCRIQGIRFISAEPDLEEIIRDSRWYTRGWTYQEFLLSKRLLVFTSSQVFFVCQVEACAEDTMHHSPLNPRKGMPGENRGYYFNRHNLRIWETPWAASGSSTWEFYNNVVEDYTRRQLTNESDALPAVSGILRAIGRYCNDRFLCGLPAKKFPYCLLWHPSGPSQRNGRWPSWSWAGWTGATLNPARNAVESRWETDGGKRPMTSSLQDLKFIASDGTQVPVDQVPSDEELQYFLCSDIDQLPDPPPLDQPSFVDGGHLQFAGESILLTIEPDTKPPVKSSTAPLLRQYRILHGGEWVGAIFLGPEAAGGGYPSTTERCEFVKLTSFSCLVSGIGPDILQGLPIEGRREPSFFPRKHYDAALQQSNHRRNYDRSKIIAESMINGMMVPSPQVDMNHVMWVESKDGMIYRKAVGVIIQGVIDDDQWKRHDFCLW